MENGPVLNADDLPVDIPDALNRAMGDFELIQMLYDEFKSTAAELLAQIRTVARAYDLNALESLAHQLKGAAGSMSVFGVATLSLELEHMGKGTTPFQDDAVDRLEREINRFNQYMANFDWAQL